MRSFRCEPWRWLQKSPQIKLAPSSRLACRNFACSLPFAGNQLRNLVTLSEVPTRNPNPSAFDPAAFVAIEDTGHRVCVWNGG
jgi:hypothetical protein